MAYQGYEMFLLKEAVSLDTPFRKEYLLSGSINVESTTDLNSII